MKAGQEIGHYRVLERLGGGGMGEVFRAEDLRLGRSVALKFLSPELGRDAAARQRFVQEAQAASALDHPNICTLYDIDETEHGRLFLAMAFYEGETLKKRLAAGPLPLDEALEIGEQVARGLAKAHASGIVHRDVKPANLMLTRDGVVKIVDFGLAKLAGAPGLTRSGASVGTPAYMSPEQARGEAVDHRTDLWSLGVVLYEMLAGRRPFQGSSEGEILHGILYGEPSALSTLRSGVPLAVEELVGDFLARQPGRRLATAGEAVARIQAVREEATELTEGRTLTRPAVRAASSASPTGRSRRLGWVIAVGAAMAIVAAFSLWVSGREGPSDVATVAPPTAEPEMVASALPERKMIVVLPFENLGPPEHEYFAAGMTEEITSRLARVGGLGVISRNTAAHYPAAGKSMAEIGDDLGVGFVLEGTVRWAPEEAGAGRVRITPQLIRVADDTHLWADAYQATLDDVFRVQAEIAGRVVAELEVTLLASEREAITTRPTESAEAYNAYLRGLYHRGFNVGTGEHAWGAVEALEEAVRRDPGFLLAWVDLAEAHGVLFAHHHDRTDERAEASRRAAERALELAPESPHAHLASGRYHYFVRRDFERALTEYEDAMEELPNSAEVRFSIAHLLRRQGEWAESLAMYDEAIALDPRNVEYWSQLQNSYLFLRRYQDAIDVGRRMVALDPTASSALADGMHYLGHLHEAREWWERTRDDLHRTSFLVRVDYLEGKYDDALERLAAYDGELLHLQQNFHAPKELAIGAVRAAMGDVDGAQAAFDRAREILEAQVAERPEDALPHSALGLAWAGFGQADAAIRHGRRAVELTPVSEDALDGPGYLIALARIYARVGETKAALGTLERLFSIPAMISIPLLELDPVFDGLRDHPRYTALVERYRGRPVDLS